MEALDCSLREVLGKNYLFGGITVLFRGDFHQILPVVPRGSRSQIISVSLRKSRLWGSIELHHLHQNMRLEQTADSEEFAQWLLQVGVGQALDDAGNITLPAGMKCGNTVDDLINAIYPGIGIEHKPDQFFLDCTILSCKNDDVDDLNQTMLAKFPGNERVLMSADSVVLEAGVNTDFQPYPVEFLNSLKTSGLPLAQLALKIGCPLMLLRNLDPINGLCNGTRMILLKIQAHVLECCILGGRHKGHIAFIPRISLEPSNEDLPIKLC